MTANEYREALDRLGLTQAGAAKLLHVDERTSRRWALGERDVPMPVALILKLCEAEPRVLRLLTKWSE